MREKFIKKFQGACPDVLIVDSGAKDIHYFFDSDKSRFGVSATADEYGKNIVKLTVERAKEILSYIKENGCLPNFDGRYFIFGGDTHTEAVLNEAQAKIFCDELEDMIEFRERSSGVKYELKKGVVA